MFCSPYVFLHAVFLFISLPISFPLLFFSTSLQLRNVLGFSPMCFPPHYLHFTFSCSVCLTPSFRFPFPFLFLVCSSSSLSTSSLDLTLIPFTPVLFVRRLPSSFPSSLLHLVIFLKSSLFHLSYWLKLSSISFTCILLIVQRLNPSFPSSLLHLVFFLFLSLFLLSYTLE